MNSNEEFPLVSLPADVVFPKARGTYRSVCVCHTTSAVAGSATSADQAAWQVLTNLHSETPPAVGGSAQHHRFGVFEGRAYPTRRSPRFPLYETKIWIMFVLESAGLSFSGRDAVPYAVAKSVQMSAVRSTAK